MTARHETGSAVVSADDLRGLMRVWRTLQSRPKRQADAVRARDVVKSVMRALKVEERLGEEGLRGKWNELVGPFLASQTRPDTLHHRVLTVLAANPSVLFHLTPMRGKILAKLQEAFGKERFRDVIFRVG